MNSEINKKQEKKSVTTYYATCPKCKKEIKGTNKGQVKYNLKLHLEKHKKESKK